MFNAKSRLGVPIGVAMLAGMVMLAACGGPSTADTDHNDRANHDDHAATGGIHDDDHDRADPPAITPPHRTTRYGRFPLVRSFDAAFTSTT